MKQIVIFSAIFLVLIIVFYASCSSVPLKQHSNTDIIALEDIESQNIEAIVVNGVIDFTLSEYRGMWNTAPDNGNLLFFATVASKMYREEELELAISEAARQASMLYNTKVDVKFAVKSNNRDLGYLEAIDIQYDKALEEDLKSKIIVRSHYIDNEGTYVLAELEGINFKGNFSDILTLEGEPDWLYNIPEIPGYLVSIGSVQRSRYKIDSIRLADEQALANLAKQVSVVVKAKRIDRDSEISGTTFSETNYEVTSTYIRGFYVLGRWSSDNGNTYHTLAVCPENQ